MTATTKRLAHNGIAPRRRDLFAISPFRFTLVQDPEHPLYQRRVRRPFVEEIVQGMMRHGVQEAVVIRQNGENEEGPIWEVVDGRQRVINAREVWLRQEAQGVKEEARITVPVKVSDLSDRAAMEMAMVLNAHTQAETPLEKAEFIKKYLDVAGDSAETRAAIMRDYRMTADMITHHLKFLAADPSVHEAVEQGKMSVTAAAAIATKVPRARQKEVLAKNVRTVKDARQAAKAVATGKEIKKGPRILPEGDIRRLRDALIREGGHDEAVNALNTVLGEATSGPVFTVAQKVFQKVEMIQIGKAVAAVPNTKGAAKSAKGSRT